MTETYQFGLPLLAGAQAQKHVTVNEALARLDAVAQLRVVSDLLVTPPGGAVDGQAYIVASGGTGPWSGHDGEIALYANGGWVFLAPKAGWQAWVETSSLRVEYSGAQWAPSGTGSAAGGSATRQVITEIDHPVGGGGTSTVAGAIPGNQMVFGVTGRVIEAIGGTVSTWSLGVAGSANRYGSGLGVALNSQALGLTGAPVTYYSAEDLILSADSGTFSGGVVRLAVHGLEIDPPAAV